MADKLTQQITDALSKAAADPAGLPLLASKADPGLFPATAKPAAQKCLADGLVRAIRSELKGKSPREVYGLTERGWEFLLAAVNPKQVLEDFVRVLEARRGEVGELLDTARQMAESLQGLKDAVTRVLPRVSLTRIETSFSRDAESAERSAGVDNALRSADSASRLNGVAVLGTPAAELAAAIAVRLADWAASARVGEDCPLPELFRSLTTREPAPTIGEFHDALRQLEADGSVYLHPWTGPLYALPEPAYALLAGHNVAYYASARQ